MLLLLRRRNQSNLVVCILGLCLLFVAVRVVTRHFLSSDDVNDAFSENVDEQTAEGADGGQVAEDSEAGLDDVQRQIRRLLVVPGADGPWSADSDLAGGGRKRRKKGRRGKKRRRRRRGGRKRGGGVGTAAAVSPRGDFSQHGQSKFVDRKLGGYFGGFFIESGASDGETGSNSLFFEVERNWTGLLIEPNPKSFAALRAKRRRTYALNACISPTGSTTTVRFKPAGGIGGIVDHMPPGHRQLVDRYGFDDVNVTCFGLYDVIRSLPIKVSRVNYWSLDVEGAELAILEQIDWDQLVPVDIISIEYKVKDVRGQTDQQATAEKLMALRKVFEKTQLYEEIGKIHDVDIIFGRKDMASFGPASTDEQVEGDQNNNYPAEAGGDTAAGADAATAAEAAKDDAKKDEKAKIGDAAKDDAKKGEKAKTGDAAKDDAKKGEKAKTGDTKTLKDGKDAEGGEEEDENEGDDEEKDGGDKEDGKEEDYEDGGDKEDGNKDDGDEDEN